MTKNKNCDTVFTGSHDGFITSWDVATGESHRIGGVGHGNQMNGMVTLGESIFTCGIDNAIKEVSMMTKSFANTNVKLASQPRGLAGNGTTLVVPCEKEVQIKKDDVLGFYQKMARKYIFFLQPPSPFLLCESSEITSKCFCKNGFLYDVVKYRMSVF